MRKQISPLSKLNKDELSSLADRIVYLRSTVLHMTQEKFATSVGISQTYLSVLENKKKGITESALLQICRRLHVNLDWLLYGGPDDDIFADSGISKDYLSKSLKEDAMNQLQAAYSLKKNETEFLGWYLNLSSEDRQKLEVALYALVKLPVD